MRVATQPDAGGSATWGELINQRARGIADTVARWLEFTGVTPNMLTVMGFLLTLGVAYVIASGYERLGGVLVVAAGLFDMLDGAVARVRGLKTRFGGFLGSLLVSYTRARAEGLQPPVDCEVGWLPRPQRVVLLAAGLITGLVIPALWVLAVLTNVTALQRIMHVRRELGGR